MVVWENVARKRIGGGLDLTDFHSVLKAMKYRTILKLMINFDTEWVFIA